MKRGHGLFVAAWSVAIGLSFLAGMRGRPAQFSEGANREIGLASGNPVVSPTAALRLGDPVGSTQAFCHAIQGLEEADEFKAVFDALLPELELPASHDALFLLADAWAAKAPEEAADWLLSLKFDDPRNPFLFSALSQWSSRDPAGALAWLQAHQGESGSSQDYLLASMIRGSAMKDPAFALKLLMEAPDSPERLGSMEFVSRAWLDEGFESAADKLAGIPDSEDALRQRAIRQLVEHAAVDEVDAVREWSGELSSIDERRMATAAVAARLSRVDPVAAASWADDLDDTEARSLAYGEIATRWARVDPLAAGGWLAERSGRPDVDLAARAVAWSTVGIDPGKAFGQVAGITHEPLRNQSFEQLGRVWMSDQPLAAKAFFESDSPIPPDIRKLLLQSFE